jgi:thiazole synthase
MLQIADKSFSSHLFTGTGKFSSADVMIEAIRASGSQLVTMAMKRVDLRNPNDAILALLLAAGVQLLPNTSGAKTADEAIFAARLAREALGTNWVKLEIHPDARYLQPDPIETLKAAEALVKQGFVVLPYCGADAVLVNTAIAVASDPVRMAQAFRLAVEAGVLAARSGMGPRHQQAQASSPLTQFLQFSQEGA